MNFDVESIIKRIKDNARQFRNFNTLFRRKAGLPESDKFKYNVQNRKYLKRIFAIVSAIQPTGTQCDESPMCTRSYANNASIASYTKSINLMYRHSQGLKKRLGTRRDGQKLVKALKSSGNKFKVKLTKLGSMIPVFVSTCK